MRRIITIALTVAAIAVPAPSHAQSKAKSKADTASFDAHEAKLGKCRFASPSTFIGMNAADLETKCGRMYRSNVTTTAAGRSEQRAYGSFMPGGPYFYIYLDGGVVTAVQSK